MEGPAKTVQISGRSRREEILEAAAACLASRGIHSMNAQAIADELGISQAKVFYHFSNMQELFDALIEFVVTKGRDHVQRGLAAMSQSASQYQRLSNYLRCQLRWAEEQPHHVLTLVYAMIQGVHNDSHYSRIQAALHNGEETIMGILATGIVEGEFQLSGRPRDTAIFLHRTLQGMMIDMARSRSVTRGQEYFEILEREIGRLRTGGGRKDHSR